MGGGWDSEEQQADRISCGKVGGARRLLTVLWEAYELGAWFFLICVNSVVQLRLMIGRQFMILRAIYRRAVNMVRIMEISVPD